MPKVSKTAVVFRRFTDKRDGDVIALMPELPATVYGDDCSSYMQVGQHGAASYDLVMRKTRPATKKEYNKLKCELENMGYAFRVVRRRTETMRQKCMDAANWIYA